jgi:protein O-mannosyl-transferase
MRQRRINGIPDLPSETAPGFLSSWRPYVVLSLIVAAVFGRSAGFGLTCFDDDILLINQYHLFGDTSRFLQLFRELYLGAYYRPVVSCTLMLDAAVGGQEPWMYHVSNCVYHAAAVMLVFALFQKLGVGKITAFIGAALVAVHPLATQSAVWIPGRNDILAAVMILASLLFFLRYASGGGTGDLLLQGFFFFAGMLTKETAVIIPVLCIIAGFFRDESRLKPRRWLHLVPVWAAVGISWYFLRLDAIDASATGGIAGSVGGFLLHIPLLAVIPAKIVFPVDLSPYPVFEMPWVIGGVVLWCGLLVVLAGRRFRNSGILILGAALVVLPLVPGLFAWFADLKHRFDYLECRAYLSLIGGVLIAAHLLEKRLVASGRGVIAAVAIVVVAAGGSLVYSGDYRNSVSHWGRAVESAPNSADAWYNYGIAMMNVSQASAVEPYRRAIALRPEAADYHNNLGICYGGLKRYDEAEAEFRETLRLKPDYPQADFNYGYLELLRGNSAHAEELLASAALHEPAFIQPRRYLCQLLVQQGRFTEARKYAGQLQALGAPLPPEIMKLIDSGR